MDKRDTPRSVDALRALQLQEVRCQAMGRRAPRSVISQGAIVRAVHPVRPHVAQQSLPRRKSVLAVLLTAGERDAPQVTDR